MPGVYAVILAGGGGTRLWPLSRPERPKPFLPLLGPESLFQATIRRLREGPELGLGSGDLFVVTDRRYARLVREQAPGVAVVEEPLGRNTAAAIALATVAIGRDEDEVMAVLPADHVIQKEGVFRGVLHGAETELARGRFGIESPLVTLGIEVDRPATEYGYLIPDLDRPWGGRLTAYPLLRFREKPDAAAAEVLRQQPGVAWNAGIFLWRRRAIRAALQAHAPEIIGAVTAAWGDGSLAAAYPSIRSVSIDYAVLEPAAAAGQVVMGAMQVGWSDLGSWTSLLAALGAAGSGRVVQVGEAATASARDLIIRRVDGRLRLEEGPAQGILDPDGPSAVLAEARSSRPDVEQLLDRVTTQEVRS